MQRKTKMDGEPGKNDQKGNKIAGKTNYEKKIYVYIDMAVDIEIDLIETWQPLFLIKW